MATETLILRPTSGMVIESVSRFPEDTATDDTWLLVSEEVADDDATYVCPVLISALNLNFLIPLDYKILMPDAIKIVVRARIEDGSIATTLAGNYATSITYSDDGSSYEFGRSNIDNIPLSEEYQTILYEVPYDNIQPFWEMLGVSYNGGGVNTTHIGITSTGDDGKTGTMRVTQVYLEIDFEVEDPPTGIFIKRNGAYIEASQIYQKINGSWTEITADEYKTILKNSIQT